ncbi:alpha/beta fold hydrolase [Natrinema hispanicum]|uniref:Pimeloyl-ACP methyl ester carboxylesterase n=1 Tax=Natrinema hispanicum TaxID=392421 RepID=A0A1H9YVA0_9EURY|nr:alpha/beta hydrolase [Natrinema hispanicum]SDC24994.1 Pimeloyl-ACP methyl ester carboxylesterase [Natrinema hispanicum]SES73107.1 Pimeloyl-ACP methyl ester carboxylesterase [Natrinema hispanicum]
MAALELDDGTIHYQTSGDGRPLVFVHGGWMDGTAWEPQVNHFADEYRVVTLDVRGHGSTGATDADQYSIELFTDDLEALLSRLEGDQPILCGLSLGSMVVQEFLDRHPNSASAAILGGAVRSMPPVELPTAMKSLWSPLPALTTSLSLSGSTGTFQSMLQSIQATTGKRWLSVDSDVRAEAIDGVGDISATEYRKIFDALYQYDPPELTGVETPTLVVHGDQEASLVKRQGSQIAAEVADGTRVELSDSGHLVNLDRPHAFNRVTANFLERVTAA